MVLFQQLSKPCLFEVRRVMRQRAASVDLQPEVEEPCLNDLASLCSENLEKGQEVCDHFYYDIDHMASMELRLL